MPGCRLFSFYRNVTITIFFFKFVIHKREIQKAVFEPAVQSLHLPLVVVSVTTAPRLLPISAP